ncbi:peptidase dimerization domain protein [Dialister sp. CAG:357]|jgi:glutamate carboxypeptidase|uniref:M20 family metallopeptidase n=1 Tax=Dialister TaxID=39948 RepID=UPI00033B4065|nr:M20 family metallopeptidase [Dialister massiliensis]MEE1350235.1 M20 family metallopeptidase [Dialister hominis]CDD80951.1 peptidase dimerization domain protein [Dialister sp. CAG:357]
MEDVVQLFDKVDQNREAMVDTWKLLVDRDCGSGNKAGVDGVGRDVKDFLEKCGFKVWFHEYEKAGNMLVAEYGDASKPFIVLTGHMDTVFGDGTAAARPFTIKDGKVTGPGVLDMKGGVTILLYAVRFLLEAGYNRYRIKIILAGDEEVAHGNSTASADYEKEAKGAIMGFNLETGFVDNSVVIERKGVAQYLFEVDGVGAHAGNNPEDGRSAVEELAHKILDIQAETDWQEGTTVNCGVIAGGTVANAVPEHAWVKVDVRFKTTAGMERIEKAFQTIAKKQYVESTTTCCKKLVVFPPMERLESSEKLFERAEAIAEKYGFPKAKAIAVGGGSDSAHLTACGIPTLCALGVRGQFNHTEREWAEEESLFERTKLLMALLSEL